MTQVPVYVNDQLQVNLTVDVSSMLGFLNQVKTRVCNVHNRLDIRLDTNENSLTVGSFNPDAFIPRLFNDHTAATIIAVKLYTDSNWKSDARP